MGYEPCPNTPADDTVTMRIRDRLVTFPTTCRRRACPVCGPRRWDDDIRSYHRAMWREGVMTVFVARVRNRREYEAVARRRKYLEARWVHVLSVSGERWIVADRDVSTRPGRSNTVLCQRMELHSAMWWLRKQVEPTEVRRIDSGFIRAMEAIDATFIGGGMTWGEAVAVLARVGYRIGDIITEDEAIALRGMVQTARLHEKREVDIGLPDSS